MRYSVSYDRELCAGEMLAPAGFCAGTGVSARWGLAAGRETKSTAQLDKSGRAVLSCWHEGMTLVVELLPSA